MPWCAMGCRRGQSTGKGVDVLVSVGMGTGGDDAGAG